MPKYDGNLTNIDVTVNYLADLSEKSGLLYALIRKMVRSVGDKEDYNFAKTEARELCQQILEKLK